MGESQIATLPDSQNHHHVATGATAVIQTEVIRRGSDHVLVVKDRQPTLNGERMLQVRLPRGDERCAYAPWWSASGDLTARTIKARPAQGTPWWSASGVAPSSGCSIHLGVQVPTQRGVRARHRGHMPHGGQPVGDLTARTIKAGPAQVTPWWSASGVAPSTGFSSQPGVQVPTQRGARARPEGGRE